MKGIVRILAVACAPLGLAAAGFAQGGTSSTISDIVVDSSGAILPGADVNVRNNATGVGQNTITNSQGAFSFSGLNVGTYTVTIALPGFKTFVAKNVVVTAGAPARVKGTLELGGVSEQATVSSTSEIIQTQSSTVSTTLNTNQTLTGTNTNRVVQFVTRINW